MFNLFCVRPFEYRRTYGGVEAYILPDLMAEVPSVLQSSYIVAARPTRLEWIVTPTSGTNLFALLFHQYRYILSVRYGVPESRE